MPLRKQRKVSTEAIIALCLHWLLTVVFAAAFVLVVVMLFKPLKLPGNPGWPELLLLASGVACTITALARRLPLQNVLLAVFIIAVLGGAVHALGAITGIPFGPFEFGESIGPQVFKTLPWAVPLIWVLAILNSRGVARLILRPWRKISAYGFWLIGVTAALTLLFDFALEPFASRVKHYWLWTPTKFPVTWQGRRWSNFLGWAAVSVLILGVHHARPDQQTAGQEKHARFSSVRHLAGRDFAVRQPVARSTGFGPPPWRMEFWRAIVTRVCHSRRDLVITTAFPAFSEIPSPPRVW